LWVRRFAPRSFRCWVFPCELVVDAPEIWLGPLADDTPIFDLDDRDVVPLDSAPGWAYAQEFAGSGDDSG
jgi:hypothetical protein